MTVYVRTRGQASNGRTSVHPGKGVKGHIPKPKRINIYIERVSKRGLTRWTGLTEQ